MNPYVVTNVGKTDPFNGIDWLELDPGLREKIGVWPL
jgi:hypothetical protein